MRKKFFGHNSPRFCPVYPIFFWPYLLGLTQVRAKFQLRSWNLRVKFHEHLSSRLLKSLKSSVGVNLLPDLHGQIIEKAYFRLPWRYPTKYHTPLERSQRDLSRDEIWDPVWRWAPCAQSFVLHIPTFYSLGTPFLMRLDSIAQQLFAAVSTRGESTCGRQRPKNTPVLTRKWPPGLCFMLIRRASGDPPHCALGLAEFQIPGELSSKNFFFVFGPNSPRLGPGDPRPRQEDSSGDGPSRGKVRFTFNGLWKTVHTWGKVVFRFRV